ncbi:uncharacterized protein LOC115632522 [Scaptodrosophila lebanonensis]|uniref:Uncharacterized protein LOC115632522 n=1 Tax=Drosophila lebanonensis TaxID=7225 RepID=A0A6J2UDS9_DROLE|nr:uncharacterized protein LOC115632522 [Scaptodrosophila lebanonensis]
MNMLFYVLVSICFHLTLFVICWYLLKRLNIKIRIGAIKFPLLTFTKVFFSNTVFSVEIELLHLGSNLFNHGLSKLISIDICGLRLTKNSCKSASNHSVGRKNDLDFDKVHARIRWLSKFINVYIKDFGIELTIDELKSRLYLKAPTAEFYLKTELPGLVGRNEIHVLVDHPTAVIKFPLSKCLIEAKAENCRMIILDYGISHIRPNDISIDAEILDITLWVTDQALCLRTIHLNIVLDRTEENRNTLSHHTSVGLKIDHLESNWSPYPDENNPVLKSAFPFYLKDIRAKLRPYCDSSMDVSIEMFRINYDSVLRDFVVELMDYCRIIAAFTVDVATKKKAPRVSVMVKDFSAYFEDHKKYLTLSKLNILQNSQVSEIVLEELELFIKDKPIIAESKLIRIVFNQVSSSNGPFSVQVPDKLLVRLDVNLALELKSLWSDLEQFYREVCETQLDESDFSKIFYKGIQFFFNCPRECLSMLFGKNTILVKDLKFQQNIIYAEEVMVTNEGGRILQYSPLRYNLN